MKYIYSLLVIFLLVSCSEDKIESKIGKLTKIGQFDIDVDEPSDLALSYEGDAFWTVSDDDSNIYKLSLTGEVIRHISTKYEDLEGVTVLDSTKLAIISEQTRKIAIIDIDGNLIKEITLHIDGEYNKGLEGIVFNPDNNHFYVVNEKYPALLIELNRNFEVVNEKEITFVNDLSAITYDKKSKSLILLSDESEIIAVCDLQGNLIKKYEFSIQQAEGICIKNDQLFIVSDPLAILYQLKF